MNKTPAPKVAHDRSIPLVWIVPIIAALICAWLGYREFHDLGPEISINFADASGVEAGKTTLEYKGVAVGTVRSVELRKGLVGIAIKLRLKKEATELANGGSKFWIVHPEIGLSGVHGLETLVSGVRLNVSPGNGPTTKEFEGLDKTPAPDVTDEGRTFILQSDKLGSLTTGSPVFYRELKVGAVEASRLSSDSTLVQVRIHIDAPYADLVRTSTHFWNAGGFNFKINLFGAQLKETSLESLVTGGVAFATPDSVPLAAAAGPDTVFTLASEADKDWLKWSPKIPIKSVDSIVQKSNSPSILPSLIK
ncbi:MAG TPA: MlaD family protein [Opitutaceae bacterium]|jgi:paraquat-inducible protein B|nr:MlaD family protein [Opitutaceae bacterium]